MHSELSDLCQRSSLPLDLWTSRLGAQLLLVPQRAGVAGDDARTARETCAIYWMLLAEVRLTRQKFGAMPGGIALLRVRMG
jgi:hypothetical protein